MKRIGHLGGRCMGHVQMHSHGAHKMHGRHEALRHVGANGVQRPGLKKQS